MFESVLVVCTGNICRSPMGEYLLRARWERPGARVSSAGTAALIHHPADDEAMAVMAEHGVDMSPHRARQVTTALVAGHDLILTMEEHHTRWLLSHYPEARGRVYPMLHWVESGAPVPDPYCQGRAAFERTRALLEPAVDAWIERL